MTTRNGSTYRGLSKTPTVTPIPKPKPTTITSLAAELESLNRKYTSVLSKLDELLPLKERVDVLESECARLKNELQKLSLMTITAASSEQHKPPSGAFYDIEGNLIAMKVCDSKSERRSIKKKKNKNVNKPQHRTSSPEHNFVHSVPTNTQQHTSNNVEQKWKWFHISSITPLSSSIVINYVSCKLNGSLVRCYSLTPRSSKIFKVGVPVNCGNVLFGSDFWPLGTVVRDFHVRKNFHEHPPTVQLT